MKKAFPYIILGIVLVAVAFLVAANLRRQPHIFDERITLRKKDKIPYGAFVAYENLKYIFPKADITINRNTPVFASLFTSAKPGRLWMILSPQFMANESEMEKMISFAKAGNQVFISTRNISMTAMEFFRFKSSLSFDAVDTDDSLNLVLHKPIFNEEVNAFYPGRSYDTYLFKFDSAITRILATDEQGDPLFIHLKAGKGNIYIHLAPLAFSNYFLLHKNNMRYYESVLSVIPGNINNVIWDEYYLNKLSNNEQSQHNKSWLSVLMRYPSLRAGLLTAFIALLVYVLLEMRRRQRIIPVIEPPVNDSLNFVKTIGRLYFEKGDHRNLAQKMSVYFLEHVRSRYQLPTNRLDEDFIKALHFKSGYDEEPLKQIIDFISYTAAEPAISEQQLAHFYKQLELFYKTT